VDNLSCGWAGGSLASKCSREKEQTKAWRRDGKSALHFAEESGDVGGVRNGRIQFFA